MISKAKSKFIKSLKIKKYRKQEQCFVVEGRKSVAELLASDYDVVMVLGTPAFLSTIRPLPGVEVIEASESDLVSLGTFESNDGALAVARMKPERLLLPSKGEWMLALDDIRDPGNLGTIIRIADWYGIKKIVASLETADRYNPKVISASMGSFLRVDLCYTDLPAYIDQIQVPVVGAFLDGDDVHTAPFGYDGILVIGNESHGISEAVSARVSKRVTIPGYGGAESLNAAAATAVILDNLRRTLTGSE
ncbi:MAG: RNA methyltransferase [Bacteroidota bacterium]|jgi:TrmH family RNA methyltransferase|nr:MAG: RNA methyltransferase [Bacteroidota bacterium]